MQEGRHQFGKWSEDEISAANSALDSLRAFRNRLAQELSQTAEFFEPNHRIDVDSRKTKPRKLKFFNQTASLHSWIFRHEIRLKNLSVIDSYLLGVDQSTPFVTYMMARYELELVATLNYLGAELKKAVSIDLRDWGNRGKKFLSELCRGRYASSDPAIADLLKQVGVTASAVKPIRITDAIRELALNDHFSNAARDYDFLSNICHHNGSSHQLFHQSMRWTDNVLLPSGDRVVVRTPAPAVTLKYPSQIAHRASVVQTASLVLACSAWVERILTEMPSVPFTDDEISSLTGGEIQNAMNYAMPQGMASPLYNEPLQKAKPGKNDPCLCGSGKKYKNCCLTRAH